MGNVNCNQYYRIIIFSEQNRYEKKKNVVWYKYRTLIFTAKIKMIYKLIKNRIRLQKWRMFLPWRQNWFIYKEGFLFNNSRKSVFWIWMCFRSIWLKSGSCWLRRGLEKFLFGMFPPRTRNQFVKSIGIDNIAQVNALTSRRTHLFWCLLLWTKCDGTAI